MFTIGTISAQAHAASPAVNNTLTHLHLLVTGVYIGLVPVTEMFTPG